MFRHGLKRWLKNGLKIFAVVLFFTAMGLVYLWPAPLEIFHALPDSAGTIASKMPGVGQDGITIPYFYTWIPELFRKLPQTLLNGAMYTPQFGAPAGAILWIPYVERVIPIVGSVTGWFSPEQASLVFTVFLHVLAGSLGYLLARKLKWNAVLSLAFGVCLSFTPFTHFRDQMHLVLSGVYCFPLLGLTYLYVLEAMESHGALKKRSLWIASLCLVLTLTTAHYLVIVTLTILPLVVFLFHRQAKKKGVSWAEQIKAGAILFLPFICLLVWIKLAQPISIESLRRDVSLSENAIQVSKRRAWDLLVFCSRPLHYLSGNFDPHAWEWNPIRKKISEYVWEHNGQGGAYPQELSSGIRWMLWIPFFIVLIQGLRRKRKKLPFTVDPVLVFAFTIAFWAYLCSLSPRAIAPLGIGIAPSRWIYALIPEVRAPNRWSAAVSFTVALVAFIAYSGWISRLKSASVRVLASFTVLAFAVVDAPPTLHFPLDDITPVVSRPQVGCGLGVHFPYLRGDHLTTYHEIAALRGTDCRIINAQQSSVSDAYFYSVMNEPFKNPQGVKSLLSCLGVEWLHFEAGLEASGSYVNDSKSCELFGFSRASRAKDGLYCSEPKARSEPLRPWTRCLPLASSR